MELALGAGRLQARVYLWPCAMHHHETHAEAIKQGNIVDDVTEIVMLEGFAGEHQYKGFSPMLIDVRRGVAKPFDVILSISRHDLFSSNNKVMQA